jgi:uncharacterized protein YbjT (DUF2867 family)
MRVVMVGATGRHAHWVLRELTKRGVEVRRWSVMRKGHR